MDAGSTKSTTEEQNRMNGLTQPSLTCYLKYRYVGVTYILVDTGWEFWEL